MTFQNDLIKKFGLNLSKNVKLSNYSWFNLGGNADYFFKAKDKDHLKSFLTEANKKIRNCNFRSWFKHFV